MPLAIRVLFCRSRNVEKECGPTTMPFDVISWLEAIEIHRSRRIDRTICFLTFICSGGPL